MTKLKVKRLKWKNLKVRESVLHFCQNKKKKKKRRNGINGWWRKIDQEQPAHLKVWFKNKNFGKIDFFIYFFNE